MDLKDVKDRLNDAIETGSSTQSEHNGLEVDESEAKAAREKIDENMHAKEETTTTPPVHR